MAVLGDRVLFATGDAVAELLGSDIRVIKSTFKTSSLSAGLGRAYIIEPDQPAPAFIIHDAHEPSSQWWRSSF